MAANKRHHFVPRFYLRRFSPNGRSVRLFNLRTNRIVPAANLDRQCYRNYFYGKTPELENVLGEVESVAAHILRRLSAGEVFPQRSVDHVNLVIFLLLQFARTTYLADSFDEVLDRFAKHILSQRSDIPQDVLAGVKIVHTEPAREALRSTMISYPLVLDLEWKLLKIVGDDEFITSDNPVVLYNQLMTFRNFGSSTGLACKGLQIFFPIDPKTQVVFYDAKVYGVGNKKDYVLSGLSRDDIHQLNILQMVSAHENIYCGDASDPLAICAAAQRFLRREKTTMSTRVTKETETSKHELVLTSRNDVATNLNLMFLRIIKPAKRWRSEFQAQKLQPAV